jgi:hypothetical protein
LRKTQRKTKEKGTKKIGCLTTTDFQKTNYLKTNLLKQIKKNIFVGSKPILFFSRCKDTQNINNVQVFLQKNAARSAKIPKNGDNS